MAETIAPMEGTVRASLRAGQTEEVFRQLWASLFYSGRPVGRSVMVCSADEGEGASTIACGLALAGSTLDGSARVALVDFNLRDPAIHRLLRVPQTPGISEVLTQNLPAESAAQRVNTSLDVYAVGNATGRLLEVLRSDKLSGFLSTLAEGYDHVLVDVAAVNHYPDAQVLAGVVKDVVLVAHTDRTPREAVAQAKKRLETSGGQSGGVGAQHADLSHSGIPLPACVTPRRARRPLRRTDGDDRPAESRCADAGPAGRSDRGHGGPHPACPGAVALGVPRGGGRGVGRLLGGSLGDHPVGVDLGALVRPVRRAVLAPGDSGLFQHDHRAVCVPGRGPGVRRAPGLAAGRTARRSGGALGDAGAAGLLRHQRPAGRVGGGGVALADLPVLPVPGLAAVPLYDVLPGL